MLLAKVVGQVVSTVKEPGLANRKLLVVQPIGTDVDENVGPTLVAVDLVGAGDGEVVLVTTGGAARTPEGTERAPADAAVVGIADTVVREGKVTFRKT